MKIKFNSEISGVTLSITVYFAFLLLAWILSEKGIILVSTFQILFMMIASLIVGFLCFIQRNSMLTPCAIGLALPFFMGLMFYLSDSFSESEFISFSITRITDVFKLSGLLGLIFPVSSSLLSKS